MPGYTMGSVSLRNVCIWFGFVNCFLFFFQTRPALATLPRLAFNSIAKLASNSQQSSHLSPSSVEIPDTKYHAWPSFLII